MSYEEIKKICTEFLTEAAVMKTLEEEPAGLCFETVFPLQVFLSLKGVQCQIKTGRPEGTRFDGTKGELDHFWLQLSNGDGIVDPTIRQFDINEPIIYVGNKSDSSITAKYPASFYPSYFWFKYIYSEWAKACTDLWLCKNDTEIGQKLRAKAITHRLKLASVLFVLAKEKIFDLEFRTGDHYKDFHLNLFFRPVITFIHLCEDGQIQFDFRQLPKSFVHLQNYAREIRK